MVQWSDFKKQNEKFNHLIESHKGKFHEMPSLEKAVLTDMFQELIELELLPKESQLLYSELRHYESSRLKDKDLKKIKKYVNDQKQNENII